MNKELNDLKVSLMKIQAQIYGLKEKERDIKNQIVAIEYFMDKEAKSKKAEKEKSEKEPNKKLSKEIRTKETGNGK